MKRFSPVSMLVLLAVVILAGAARGFGMDAGKHVGHARPDGLQLRFVTVPEAVTIPPAPRPNDPPKPKQPNLRRP